MDNVSGRNMFENAYDITSKSKFSTQNVQILYHLHPALSYSLVQGAAMPQMPQGAAVPGAEID